MFDFSFVDMVCKWYGGYKKQKLGFYSTGFVRETKPNFSFTSHSISRAFFHSLFTFWARGGFLPFIYCVFLALLYCISCSTFCFRGPLSPFSLYIVYLGRGD